MSAMKATRAALWTSIVAAGLLARTASGADGDVLTDLLARGGLTRGDLGERASGPADGVPYRLPLHDALRAAPIGLPLLAQKQLSAAGRYGNDAAKLLFVLALQPRFPALTRGDANLRTAGTLAQAIDLLRQPLDVPEPIAAAFAGAFGTVSGAPLPPASRQAVREAERVPEAFREPLARLLLGLFDADRWVRIAWRRVPTGVARSATHRRGLVDAVSDGSEFFPDVEDAARSLDGESLAYAGLKAVAASERAARELEAAVRGGNSAPLATLRWEIDTPRGRVLLAGTGNDRHVVAPGQKPFLLLVDLGGDDVYEGTHAAGLWPEQPVSVLLDLSGNDTYDAKGEGPAQGSGLGGVGVLFDLAGDDRYIASERAQGFGQFGVGVLVDAAGKDDYRLGSAGQGAAVFGAGLLLDRKGDDRYEILHDGQGYGGPGGIGVLADLEGNDRYEAVRDPARAGRPDPRADGQAATSNAQGAGIGRRGDGSDGHAWAGGLGVLVDAAGNDTYTCGTWCQGVGYWFGTGVLADGGGNDRYEAVWYAQASAAHHGLGTLLDVAGEDRYTLSGTGGAGLGFAWDFAAAVFVDLAGNDVYTAKRLVLGAAHLRSFALFLDASGDDRYDVASPGEAFGQVDDDPRWAVRDPLSPRWHEATQAGLFLDLGGKDTYPAGRGGDGAVWGTWENGRRTEAPRNLGAGADTNTPGALPLELRSLAVPSSAAAADFQEQRRSVHRRRGNRT
jgi:hypothetical protein